MINKLTADANESSTHCFKGAHVAGLVFFFFFLQLNYSHNYVLVASDLKQIQSNNGNDIYLSERLTNCGGVLSLVAVINHRHMTSL